MSELNIGVPEDHRLAPHREVAIDAATNDQDPFHLELNVYYHDRKQSPAKTEAEQADLNKRIDTAVNEAIKELSGKTGSGDELLAKLSSPKESGAIERALGQKLGVVLADFGITTDSVMVTKLHVNDHKA